MKALIVRASPRAGSVSAALGGLLAEELERRGQEAAAVALAPLAFGGCRACMACKNGLERCAIDDGLSPVLEELFAADALVVASPVFWADLPAQAKALIDRCYAFYEREFWAREKKYRFGGRKKLGFILAQGNGDADLYAGIAARYGEVLRDVGFDHGPGLLARSVGLFTQEAALADEGLRSRISAMAGELCG